MRRREFIVLMAGTAVWPLAARAQPQSKIPRIGIIDDAPIWEHFRRSLRDRGHVEGQTIAFEYRTAQGEPARLADAAADLARLPSLITWIEPAGALWAVWTKGRQELNENHVREAALDAGLVDVKVARFSATHSALKLVIPKAKRLGGHS